ncbi:hypothetical protein [Olsenella sp. oral taxon 809]|uniref:hypothetical protein n=1 Tax=Olsenella sp. oral taxon 809 TaxID=661086 RepID=UPI001E517232|nr:hypothetical protein [Olsenella sp. oral taxon 809]
MLRETGFKGAKAVSDEILRRYSVYHSPHAVEMFASRNHVSLRLMQACPECGLLVNHLNRQTGLCPRCSALLHVEEERAYNDILEGEIREAEAECVNAEREYATLRQRNARLCRQHGLATKSERKRAVRAQSTFFDPE